MEMQQAIFSRHSIRAYNGAQIEEEALNQILLAGCVAPVGMAMYDHMQLTVVQDPALLAQISSAVKERVKSEGDPLYGAPTLILISAGGMPFPGLDYTSAGCVMQNMVLCAVEQGLGSVIVFGTGLALAEKREWKDLLDIPEGQKVLAGLAVGKPAHAPAERERRLAIPICRK